MPARSVQASTSIPACPTVRHNAKEGLFYKTPDFPFSILFKLNSYITSTFFLAQGVLRKKLKLDLILGSFKKQLIGIFSPIFSQPTYVTKSVKIFSSVKPCKVLFFCG